jgi:hypothetical protein
VCVRGRGGHYACHRQRCSVHLRADRQWGRWGWRGRCDGQRWGAVGTLGSGGPQARGGVRAGVEAARAAALLSVFIAPYVLVTSTLSNH